MLEEMEVALMAVVVEMVVVLMAVVEVEKAEQALLHAYPFCM